MNSVCGWPGSRRQSIDAVASDGITFSLGGSPTPARSVVSEMVLRRMALANRLSASFPSRASIASRIGSACRGVSASVIRVRARANMRGALSSVGCDPCPAVPSTIRRSHNTCFWATDTACTSPSSVNSRFAENPPSSKTYSASTFSGCLASRNFTPVSPPVSSSAVAAKITSRSRRTPCLWSSSMAIKWTMPVDFMSTVPRPHSRFSRISAPNGSVCHRLRSAGTVSM